MFFKFLMMLSFLFPMAAFASDDCRINGDVFEVKDFDSKSKAENSCRDQYSKYGVDSGCFVRRVGSGWNKWESNFRYSISFNNYWSYRDWHRGNRNHSVSFSGKCNVY